MKKLCLGLVALSILLGGPLAAAQAAQAQPADPLALVSNEAVFVIRVNNLDQGLAGLTKTLAKADEDFAKQAEQGIRQGLAKLLGGADLAEIGVDTSGTHVIAIFMSPTVATTLAGGMMGGMGGAPADGGGDEEEEPPFTVAAVIQVKDYEAFRTSVAGDKKLRSEDGYDVLFKKGRELDFEATEKARLENPGQKVKVIYKETSEEVFLVRRGPYVVFLPDKEKLDGFLAPGQSIATVLSADDKKLMTESDAGLYVNVAHAAKLLQPVLAGLQMMIGMAPMMGQPDPADPDAVKQATAMKLGMGIAKFMLQFVNEMKGATVGVKFDDDGAMASTLLSMKPGAKTTAGLTLHPPSRVSSLGLLPAGGMAYVAADFRMDLFLEFLSGLLRRDIAPLLDEKTQKQMAMVTGVIDKLAACKPREAATMVGFGGKTAGVKLVSLVRFEDPALAKKTLNAAVTQAMMGEFQKQQGVTVTVKSAAEVYKGIRIDLIESEIDLKKVVQQEGGQADPEALASATEILKLFFGGSSITQRQAFVGKWMVSVGGRDPKLMRDAIDAVQSGQPQLGAHPEFQALRKKLPAKTNFVAMVNTPRVVHRTIILLNKVLQGMMPVTAKPDMKFDDSMAAFSMTWTRQQIRFDLYVPHKQITGIKNVITAGSEESGEVVDDEDY